MALTVSGNYLYVGGYFGTADYLPASRIAKWDGTYWATLGSGVNSNIRAVAVYGSDVYVGGLFSRAGGKTSN
jgi:hypothetical protein